MKRIWSFYDSSGRISSRRYGGPPSSLKQNTPPGLFPIEGKFDHLSQRVDVEALTGAGAAADPRDFVVERQDADEQRQLLQASRRDQVARAQLREIDLQRVRPLVALLKSPNDAEAQRVLDDLEIRAAEIRKDVIPTPAEKAKAERLG